MTFFTTLILYKNTLRERKIGILQDIAVGYKAYYKLFQECDIRRMDINKIQDLRNTAVQALDRAFYDLDVLKVHLVDNSPSFGLADLFKYLYSINSSVATIIKLREKASEPQDESLSIFIDNGRDDFENLQNEIRFIGKKVVGAKFTITLCQSLSVE